MNDPIPQAEVSSLEVPVAVSGCSTVKSKRLNTEVVFTVARKYPIGNLPFGMLGRIGYEVSATAGFCTADGASCSAGFAAAGVSVTAAGCSADWAPPDFAS